MPPKKQMPTRFYANFAKNYSKITGKSQTNENRTVIYTNYQEINALLYTNFRKIKTHIYTQIMKKNPFGLHVPSNHDVLSTPQGITHEVRRPETPFTRYRYHAGLI